MASSDEKKSGVLVAYDVMAAPGRSINLVADLLEEGFFAHAPLGGEVLFFEHEGRLLGRTLTGGDGRAMVPFVPRIAGRMTLTVRAGESRRVTAQETTAGIFVWDRKRPIVIVSMSALVSAPRRPDLGLPLPRAGPKLLSPDGGAVQALAALAKRAHLMYVTASDRLELPELREWTELHRLPRGPIIPLRPGPMSLARELERWQREGWTNIKGGIVETAEEAKALTDTKRKAVAAPTVASQEKWPEKTVRPKDWAEAVKQFS